MEFCGAGDGSDFRQIGWCYAATGHYHYPAGGAFHQFLQDESAFPGIGAMAGSEQPVNAQADDVLQRLEGVPALVKCTVEGYAQQPCGSYQPSHQGHIH